MDASVPETLTAAADAAVTAVTATAAPMTTLLTPVAETATEAASVAMEVGAPEALGGAALIAIILKFVIDFVKSKTSLFDKDTLEKVYVLCGILAVAIYMTNQYGFDADIWNSIKMAGGPFGAILVDQIVSSPGRKKNRTAEVSALKTMIAKLKDSDSDKDESSE